MRALEEFMLKFGVFTRISPIKTVLNGAQTQVIGGTLQTDIGIVYGLTTYADTVDPTNATLITTTQAQNLYLTIAKGATQVIQTIRVDDMLNVFAGTPVDREWKYLPIFTNYQEFALDVSQYFNPTLITGAEVYVNMWYLNREEMKEYYDYTAMCKHQVKSYHEVHPPKK